MRPRLLPLALAAALLGCPPSPPTPPGPDGPAAPGSSAPPGETPPATPKDPLAGSVFTKEQLFAIYRAERAGGAERERVLREQRIIDTSGQEVPARVKAYEAALQQYAQNDPEGWAAFVESLPQ